MSLTRTLNLDCHVRSGANATVTISVNETDYNFNLAPTIDWVPSSSVENARSISLDIVLTTPNSGTSNNYNYNLAIKAEGSDVLICGYSVTQGIFLISSQPVWDVAGWQPYDISGHQGDDALYQGNGSLQILDGQTVEFVGTIIAPLIPAQPPAP